MKRKITEFFLYVSVFFLSIARGIEPSLTNEYLAYGCQEFLKENLSEVEIETDNKKETIIVTNLTISKIKNAKAGHDKRQ